MTALLYFFVVWVSRALPSLVLAGLLIWLVRVLKETHPKARFELLVSAGLFGLIALGWLVTLVVLPTLMPAMGGLQLVAVVSLIYALFVLLLRNEGAGPLRGRARWLVIAITLILILQGVLTQFVLMGIGALASAS